MPDNEFDLGPAGPPSPTAGEDPGKGRQRVRRHWKPSLGRFIHMYVRKGEHAQPRQPGEGGAGLDDAPGPSGSNASPAEARRPRRLLLAGAALALTAAAIVTWSLVGGNAHSIAYEVLAARDPFIVKIDCGPAKSVALGEAREHDQCVNDAVKSIRDAERAHPDRLIVIDLQSPPISFTSLLPNDQKELRRALGASAGLRYESMVAGLLERIVESAGGARVSVLGLPVERREVGIDASGRTNGMYAAVIERIDCLVSAHVFYRGDASTSEEQLVQQTLIEALRSREGRPVVFRQGTAWRVLVDRGTPGPEQLAARRLVLAEAGD